MSIDKVFGELKDIVTQHPEVAVFIATVINDAIVETGVPEVKRNVDDPLGDVFAGAKALKHSQDFGPKAEEAARKFGQLVVDLVVGAIK